MAKEKLPSWLAESPVPDIRTILEQAGTDPVAAIAAALPFKYRRIALYKGYRRREDLQYELEEAEGELASAQRALESSRGRLPVSALSFVLAPTKYWPDLIPFYERQVRRGRIAIDRLRKELDEVNRVIRTILELEAEKEAWRRTLP